MPRKPSISTDGEVLRESPSRRLSFEVAPTVMTSLDRSTVNSSRASISSANASDMTKLWSDMGLDLPQDSQQVQSDDDESVIAALLCDISSEDDPAVTQRADTQRQAELEAEVIELRAMVSDLREAHGQLSSRGTNSDNQALQRMAKELEKAREELASRGGAQGQGGVSPEALKKMQAAMLSERKTHEEQIAKIKELVMQERQRAGEHTQKLEATIAQLREQLSHGGASASSESKAALTQEQQARQKAEQQVTTLQARVAELERTAQASDSEAKSRRDDLVQLRLQNTKLQEQLEAERSASAAAGDEVSSLRSQVKTLQDAVQYASQAQEQELQRVKAELEEIRAKLKAETRLRRDLYDQLQQVRGNIRVYGRIRPPVTANEEPVVLSAPEEDTVHAVDSDSGRIYDFTFSRVFGPECSQETVFADMEPLCLSVLDGFSVTVFAYGQTGAGKTYTSFGAGPKCPAEQRGVCQRALDSLYAAISERSKTGWTFSTKVSVVEVYLDTLRDLVRPVLGASAGPAPARLEVKQTPKGRVQVPGLIEINVKNPAQALAIMDAALAARVTTATKMNKQSSRSHCVLTLQVEGHNEELNLVVQSQLTFVDLAGSERVARSGAEGQALKEAQAINASLSSLGQVITGLASKAAHIPYRDSKLTFLLSESLKPGSKVLMFVNLAPSQADLAESISSLTFAQRVNSVELGQAVQFTKPLASS